MTKAAETRTSSWLQTFSGKQMFLFEPRSGDFDIRDIAHHLSLICRFNGATKKFYSVAEHSVLVAGLSGSEYALEGLMHDAAEAYVGDMIRPLKRHMPEYCDVEGNIVFALAIQFGLNLDIAGNWPSVVKEADNVALATERRDLLRNTHHTWLPLPDPLPLPAIDPQSPAIAERMFLETFVSLYAQRYNTHYRCRDCNARAHLDDCIDRNT